MRKLAHIELITEIKSIPKADRIEVAQILGWRCVVKKGEFKVGNKIIYIEVDSIVPEKPEYEFLRDRKFRIRTIKLRGQVSQGLVIPLPKDWTVKRTDRCKIGSDVTEELNITKYLSPTEQTEIQREEEAIKIEKNRVKKFMMRYSWFRRLFLSRTGKKGFPFWVQKTDEDRIQNMPHVLKQFKDSTVFITEKIDYQSGTWTSKEVPRFNSFLGRYFKKVIFVVCSRRLITNDKFSLYWKIAKKYDLESLCKKFPGIIIQGEQGSSKIQGNKYQIKEPTMWIFNIISPNNSFLNHTEIITFCNAHNLDYIPFITTCKIKDVGLTVDEWVEYAKGKSALNPKIEREGIVVRIVTNGQKMLSFKVINPLFLLKYSD